MLLPRQSTLRNIPSKLRAIKLGIQTRAFSDDPPTTSTPTGRLSAKSAGPTSVLSSSTGDPLQILHIDASHSSKSLVSYATQELLKNLTFLHRLQARNLWTDPLVSYNISHVAAKMRLLRGKGTPEDEELFEPVDRIANELNSSKILVISSPMWNYSFPYVVKQYVDIALQPGINFHERPDRPVTSGKVLVLVTSSGGAYGEVNPKDYLNSYLEDIFGMVGYERTYSIKIQGAMHQPREVLNKFSQVCARDVAGELNREFAK